MRYYIKQGKRVPWFRIPRAPKMQATGKFYFFTIQGQAIPMGWRNQKEVEDLCLLGIRYKQLASVNNYIHKRKQRFV